MVYWCATWKSWCLFWQASGLSLSGDTNNFQQEPLLQVIIAKILIFFIQVHLHSVLYLGMFTMDKQTKL
jgi:hypothetical protein